MGLFSNALMFSTLAFGAFFDCRFLYLFFGFLGFNYLMYLLTPGGKYNSKRTKIRLATWEEPKEGCIYIKNEVNCAKANELIQKHKGATHVTLTHFAIKAVAQGLNASRTFLNGKIVFGKYIPFDSVDVTCLVDIDGGKDLAALTLRKVDEMSVVEIAEFISSKAKVVKKNDGDEAHKKATKAADFFPPFILSVLMSFTKYISYYLGLDANALGLKRNNFGGAVVTSVGSLGINDVYAPHCNFMHSPLFAAVCKCIDKPIAQDGKIVIAPMMNINFTSDHRYMDGAKTRGLASCFFDVFENPEKYYDQPQLKWDKSQPEVKDIQHYNKLVEEAKKEKKTK